MLEAFVFNCQRSYSQICYRRSAAKVFAKHMLIDQDYKSNQGTSKRDQEYKSRDIKSNAFCTSLCIATMLYFRCNNLNGHSISNKNAFNTLPTGNVSGRPCGFRSQ